MKRSVLFGALLVASLVQTRHPALARRKIPPGKGAILVYTKTAGFRHASIPSGVETIRQIAAENRIAVDVATEPHAFTRENLNRYRAIVFLSTTGNVLPQESQRTAFEAYIRSGGGFLGIHAASDMGSMSVTWPFYRDLVGGVFKGHTNGTIYSDLPVQDAAGRSYGGKLSAAPAEARSLNPQTKVDSAVQARLLVEDRRSPAMKGWGKTISLADEWYGFAVNPRQKVHVMASIDESSYLPARGAMNGDHPIVWCHAYEGGRSVYTALGHPIAIWSNPKFKSHIRGAMTLAMGTVPFRCPSPSAAPRTGNDDQH